MTTNDALTDFTLKPSQKQKKPNSRQPRSLNHLLGFTLPPRSSPQVSLPPRRSAKRTLHSSHSPHQKDRFVHAQYRFILKPTGDYTAHFADPDIRFHWPDILQVIVHLSLPHQSISSTLDFTHLSSKLSCPICLSPATAARMTKCGHVFCYPCLLHYLELSEEKKGQGRRCPVCTDPVLKKDLKSVKWLDGTHDPQHIRFRLVERPTFTTLALPRSSTWPSPAVEPLQTPWHFTPDALTHAKFVLAAPDHMLTELQKDLDELRTELATLLSWSASDTQADLGLVFVRAAEAKVREQIQKVALLKTTAVMTARKSHLRQLSAIVEQGKLTEDETAGQSTSEFVTTTDDDELIAANSFAPSFPSKGMPSALVDAGTLQPTRGRRNVNPPEPSPPAYRFYQAASGQHIYLAPLDIRILLARFGSYEDFPHELDLEVESTSEGRMSDVLRRRCKYLSHLSTGTSIRLVETNLDDYLPEEDGCLSLALRQRRARRKEQVRKEERARAKSEAQVTHFSTVGDYVDHQPSTNFELDDMLRDHHDFGPEDHKTEANASPGPSQSNLPSGSKTVWGMPVAPPRETDGAPHGQPVDNSRDAWAALEGAIGSKEQGDSNERKPKNKKKKERVVINISGGYGGRGG